MQQTNRQQFSTVHTLIYHRNDVKVVNISKLYYETNKPAVRGSTWVFNILMSFLWSVRVENCCPCVNYLLAAFITCFNLFWFRWFIRSDSQHAQELIIITLPPVPSSSPRWWWLPIVTLRGRWKQQMRLNGWFLYSHCESLLLWIAFIVTPPVLWCSFVASTWENLPTATDQSSFSSLPQLLIS